MAHLEKIKDLAVKLRTEDNLGLYDISVKLGVAKSTLSRWLKLYPLPEDILIERAKQSRYPRVRIPYTPSKSKFLALIELQDYSPVQIGRIAEAAVIFRLSLLGFEVYTSIFDGAKVDIIARKSSILLKIQVKSLKHYPLNEQRPYIVLTSTPKRDNKTKKYDVDEVDIFVGYDRFADVCYVWTYEEVKSVTVAVISSDSEEMWQKCGII